MPDAADFALLACSITALLATFILIRTIQELFGFARAVDQLPPREVPSSILFDQSAKSGQAANEYISQFSIATSRNALGSFSVERASAPLFSYLRTLGAFPRSLVGVLILGGLLVTLFNLQRSVGTLGNSFTHLAEGQSARTASTASEGVKQIQISMGDLALTAKGAFLRSGVVIFVAAAILLVSMWIQYKSQQASRKFATWANGAHLEMLTARPMDQQAQLMKFGQLLDKMVGVIESFESIAAAMTTVADFGEKLDTSSRLVADAVSQLPKAINESVVQLSSEVTKDISVHLEHQIEHLKKILAIYGDQELRVRKIQQYLDGISESIKTSTAAVSGLSSLPDVLTKLVDGVFKVITRADDVNNAAAAVGRKIDQLPISELHQILAKLNALSVDLPDSVKTAVAQISASLDSRLPTISITELSEDIRNVKTAVSRMPQTSRIDDLEATLSRLAEMISESTKAGGFGRWFRGLGGN